MRGVWGFLLLWNIGAFRKIGESCGRYIAMDLSMEILIRFHWERILVRTERSGHASSLQVVEDEACYSVHLWREIQPKVDKVKPSLEDEGANRAEVGRG